MARASVHSALSVLANTPDGRITLMKQGDKPTEADIPKWYAGLTNSPYLILDFSFPRRGLLYQVQTDPTPSPNTLFNTNFRYGSEHNPHGFFVERQSDPYIPDLTMLYLRQPDPVWDDDYVDDNSIMGKGDFLYGWYIKWVGKELDAVKDGDIWYVTYECDFLLAPFYTGDNGGAQTKFHADASSVELVWYYERSWPYWYEQEERRFSHAHIDWGDGTEQEVAIEENYNPGGEHSSQLTGTFGIVKLTHQYEMAEGRSDIRITGYSWGGSPTPTMSFHQPPVPRYRYDTGRAPTLAFDSSASFSRAKEKLTHRWYFGHTIRDGPQTEFTFTPPLIAGPESTQKIGLVVKDEAGQQRGVMIERWLQGSGCAFSTSHGANIIIPGSDASAISTNLSALLATTSSLDVEQKRSGSTQWEGIFNIWKQDNVVLGVRAGAIIAQSSACIPQYSTSYLSDDLGETWEVSGNMWDSNYRDARAVPLPHGLLASIAIKIDTRELYFRLKNDSLVQDPVLIGTVPGDSNPACDVYAADNAGQNSLFIVYPITGTTWTSEDTGESWQQLEQDPS